MHVKFVLGHIRSHRDAKTKNKKILDDIFYAANLANKCIFNEAKVNLDFMTSI